MRVKMLSDAPGSPDGVTVNEYSQDQVYDVTESLAAAFIAEGFAVEDEAESVVEVPEEEPDGADTEDLTKKDSGPEENK